MDYERLPMKASFTSFCQWRAAKLAALTHDNSAEDEIGFVPDVQTTFTDVGPAVIMAATIAEIKREVVMDKGHF